ncbi:C1A family cysteine protease [Bradyrhizobium sp. F1.4.3]|uniref:C1 family peptidase n=1 Tax=Bradyrhizobium sp. F1.4.3 TaxID=3156356 RepID=UPI00339A9055
MAKKRKQMPKKATDHTPAHTSNLISTNGVFFGWKPELPDHRDLPYGAMRMALEKPMTLPPQVDLRAQCPPVYDQGNLGSCTGNAIAGAFQFDRRKQNLPDFVPSRLFIYYNERSMEGTAARDAGAFIRDGIKSIATKGVCKEPDWPYAVSKFADRPPKSCYTSATKYKSISYFRLNNANIDELKSCLAAGFPFVFGFVVYPSFFQGDTNGMVPMPGNEKTVGGHAVSAVGYNDINQRFIIRNSWGPAKGDQGYYYMPYQYLTTTSLSDDFWTVRSVTAVSLHPSS